jgi:hypothetical protein
MITREPTNTDLSADARLVAEYLRRGLEPDDAEQLAMLFLDPVYRDRVYELARSMIVPTSP